MVMMIIWKGFFLGLLDDEDGMVTKPNEMRGSVPDECLVPSLQFRTKIHTRRNFVETFVWKRDEEESLVVNIFRLRAQSRDVVRRRDEERGCKV